MLRPPRMSDAEDIYRNINDKTIARWTLNIPHPYKRKDALKYIKMCKRNLIAMKELNLLIILKDSGIVLGAIGFVELDKKNKRGKLGYWLGKRHRGKGFMSEAVKLILALGFAKLKLHRISANVFEANIVSSTVLKKAGLKLEGRTREKWFRHGKWHDVLNYSILDREYKKRKR